MTAGFFALFCGPRLHVAGAALQIREKGKETKEKKEEEKKIFERTSRLERRSNGGTEKRANVLIQKCPGPRNRHHRRHYYYYDRCSVARVGACE